MVKLPDGVTWVQFVSSKVVAINALYSAVMILLIQVGVGIDSQIVIAGQAVLNAVLRFFTSKPLNQK